MNYFFSSKKTVSFLFSVGLGLMAAASAFAADVPANLDSGLQQLVAAESLSKAVAAPQQVGMARRAIRDTERRVLVNIHLDGKATLSEVRGQAAKAGANVTAESSRYKNGVLSAFVPVSKLAEMAQSSGVLSISMGHRPIRNIGATTSGGVFVLRSDTLNAQGLNGAGITAGVLSDSYDKATTDLNGDPLLIHAADDVASGDLPGTGNPNGHTDPVVVLEDYDPAPGEAPGNDEGRAMLQIVHDVAPSAKLAFATAFVSEVDFANNIRKLRTDADCSVIVDDVFYTDEPMFSDGILAQAVDDVAFADSSTLAGHKCAYFSAAGNQQGGGYVSTFNPVADATARAGLAGQNVKLSQVPAALTTGGFHNFNPNPAGPKDISQTFLLPAESALEFDFQWNDPFDQTPPNGVSTDYNVLVFDAAGNYLASFSGTADNTVTQQPIEDILIENSDVNDAKFQVVISRAGNSPATPTARKLRYLAIDDFGSGVGATEYYQPAAPATFGHCCAAGAFGTAAYVYDDFPSNPVGPPFTPFIEDFTSPGPVTIDFDAAGNRLGVSEVRQKPDIAAPDGGNTTFFGFDYEGDNFPNFFGTSAAAPHAAGVGVLLLEKAGGPESISYAQMLSYLQSSVLDPHDVDPFFAAADIRTRVGGRHNTGGSALLTGFGNSSNASATDPNFFTLTFQPGKRGETLSQVTIDLSSAGLKFDASTDTGFPFTLGKLRGINARDITTNVHREDSDIESITISFRRNSFGPATSVSFGIDRDFIGDGGGNGADLLQGGNIFAATSKAAMSGSFTNTFGTGYVITDGFGLIDAVEAADFISSTKAQ